jgi:hypothetical protein
MLKEAFGNVSSEDVIEMLVGLGIDVGIDVDEIVKVTQSYSEISGRPIGARLASASKVDWKHDLLAAGV